MLPGDENLSADSRHVRESFATRRLLGGDAAILFYVEQHDAVLCVVALALMLPDLCGHKRERRGVRRILQIKHAKANRLAGDYVGGSAALNAIEVGDPVGAKSPRKDLGGKYGCGRNVKVRGNSVHIEGSGGGCGRCGDEARPAQDNRIPGCHRDGIAVRGHERCDMNSHGLAGMDRTGVRLRLKQAKAAGGY